MIDALYGQEGNSMVPGSILLLLLAIAVGLIILFTGKYRVHAFLVLLAAAYFVGIFSGLGLAKTVDAIAAGFGGTLKSIGIVIAAGTIIGYILEKSGGAISMAEAVLKIVGKHRVPHAMSIIGYIVSIPVFCDSGFVILSPLNKALSKRAGISLAVTAVALSTGLYATHTLVPPTPGPIAAAANLNADLGLVILLGLIASIPAALAGLYYGLKVGSKIYIEPDIEESYEDLIKKYGKLPPAKWAFAPLVVPIILIVLKSIADFPSHPFGTGMAKEFFDFIGHPITALLLGVLLSFKLVDKLDEHVYGPTGWVAEGLKNAAIIILITGAGGSFGYVLRQTGIGDYIGTTLSSYHLGLILPFIIAALLKTAQGSSTVAIITTSALLAPLLPSLGLSTPYGRALTVLAIGAGSMVVSHANDSYFWVVTQFSNMDVMQGYKLQTVATFVEGIVAAIVILIMGAVLL
ncbi:D-glycerate transporter [Thermococcus barophilus MP]|uniref:D-glycerate transporter n=1 Tax=Thermococcus barophilus (strain DSM 11836 / MP) TaxID=391623 RepID=F0LLL2_THEBM|nr:D-glycerate transporter [Thermococcus barophilus MP]